MADVPRLFEIIFDEQNKRISCEINEDMRKRAGERAYDEILLKGLTFAIGATIQKLYPEPQEQEEAFLKIVDDIVNGVRSQRYKDFLEKKAKEVMENGIDKYERIDK